MTSHILSLFKRRPKQIIVPCQTSEARRKSERKRAELHARLAAEQGMPNPLVPNESRRCGGEVRHG